MRVYIWTNLIGIDYGGDMVVAVAETLEDARAQALATRHTLAFGRVSKDDKFANDISWVSAEPDHVFDAPCAFSDWWSE